MINLKSENGITFIILVTTIVVLLIIAAVSVNLGLEGVNNTSDKQDMSTLYMVQQAVLGQYTMASSLDVADKKDESLVSNLYYGTKITDITQIDTSKLGANPSPFPKKEDYQAAITDGTNEDFYYRLKTADLKKLKLIAPGDTEDSTTTTETMDTFIVNYKTGEVYNETKQVTLTNDNILYVKGKTLNQDRNVDTTSFTD